MTSRKKNPSNPNRASRRPLSGTRILVGRARHQASALSSGLKALGAEVLEIPFIEIRQSKSYKPLDAALENLASYDWLILTSVNGVDALWARLKKLRLRKNRLQHLQIAAIGPATQKAITAHGLRVHVVPKEYVAEAVVRSLRRKVKGKRVLLARAKVARDVIPQQLRQLGAKVDVVEAYETVIPQSSKTKLRAALKHSSRRPNVITFTSSSTVRNFVALSGLQKSKHKTKRPAALQGIQLASIGPITSATLREYGLPVDIQARNYTIPGLIEAVVTIAP